MQMLVRMWAVPLLGTAMFAAACADPYTPPVLADMRLESGDLQTGVAGGPLPLPLVVSAFNQWEEPIAGARVEFSASSGSFDQAIKLSGNDGTARAVYTLGPSAGPVTIVASTKAGEIVVEFTAFAEMGEPAAFRAASGDQQTALVGEPLPQRLRVRVTNQHGVGLEGLAVSWTTHGKGELSETATETDGEGYAEVTLTLGPEPGAHTVTATVEGFFPVTFTALAN